MKEVIAFLNDLSLNNDKVWFEANRARYNDARAKVESLAAEVIAGIRSFDGSIGPLQPKDCTYRIYRDLRFSPDKTPYKTHMGIYITRGGKKSGYSGYYFHIGSAAASHMIAVGDICCEPKVLKVIREDIQNGDGDFRRIIESADPRFMVDTDGATKRVPAGFPADSPDAEFFKLKHYCLYFPVNDRFITSGKLASRITDIFRTGKPFLDYINRAIDYVREEEGFTK